MWSGMLQDVFREKESLIASLKASKGREEAVHRELQEARAGVVMAREELEASERGREGAERAMREYREGQKKFLREKQVCSPSIPGSTPPPSQPPSNHWISTPDGLQEGRGRRRRGGREQREGRNRVRYKYDGP